MSKKPTDKRKLEEQIAELDYKKELLQIELKYSTEDKKSIGFKI